MENYLPNTNLIKAEIPKGKKTFSSIALKAKNTTSTIEGVKKHLTDSLAGKHKVLRTRYTSLNRMLLGGFHFGQLVLLAGASGHGKSYLLNTLIRDFMDQRLNNPDFKFIILHFGFEMSSEVEFMRRISANTKIPFRKLMSSDDPLNKEDYKLIESYCNAIGEEPILYFENPGTRLQIEATIKNVAASDKYKDHKIVVTMDHSLLVLNEKGENEIETLAELGKMFIQLKKEYGLLGIILGQLNDKIEGERRRDPTNPAMHYPTKTDIHGSKQLYHASDVVLVVHQPALLNLEYYGKNNIPTKHLIALHALKQRNGQQGFILMYNFLKYGMFVQRPKDKDIRQEIFDAISNEDLQRVLLLEKQALIK
ncbi:DnaB-like helicase C-terminal domain-containing protein [Zeaxanthinibacter sp. PT1]|uniref:DnaB-like helicase C-terminal domain-containing protein n=1 Tax=Zeaxanthinibacter TaxID=561554 RepID=UPI00234BE2E3|nr:DnaB-like helicase C-terminal domain-containing protein [Zeaxanthinibacter sp. PT1]MDC6350729.1 DnaB-like helicase C-terminal domain-containing protein [Zeaxanthinibacter sp. PT1]